MPVLTSSTYHPPLGFSNAHIQSIYPSLFRRVRGVRWERERISTPDGDFLDLDWSCVGSDRLVIICHGMEGSTRGQYVLGMARAANRRGWDAVGWNYRGCSGEPNLLARSYHSGATEDLEVVVAHALARGNWSEITLTGFSLGGNLVLKYLGERDAVAPQVCGAVAFSVPCDLPSSARRLAERGNAIYMKRFLVSLRGKIRQKRDIIGDLADHDFRGIRSFEQFDEVFTAPLHGFASASEYWARCSSRPLLPRIHVPTLLVNARDDPFLAPASFPTSEAEASEHLYLETPTAGGHVGFIMFNAEGEYWSERRAMAFLQGDSRDKSRSDCQGDPMGSRGPGEISPSSSPKEP